MKSEEDKYYKGDLGEFSRYRVKPQPVNFEQAELRSEYYGRLLPYTVAELPEMTRIPNETPADYWREMLPEYRTKFVGRTFPLSNRDAGPELRKTCQKMMREAIENKEDKIITKGFESHLRAEETGSGLSVVPDSERSIIDYLEGMKTYGKAEDEDWY